MSIKFGDRVLLNPKSQFFTKHNEDSGNPTDVAGTVVSQKGLYDFSIIVEWDKGKHPKVENSYAATDLLRFVEVSEEDMEELVESWESMAHPLKITKQGKIRWNYPHGGVATFDIKSLANRAGAVNLQKIAALMMSYADQMLDEEAEEDQAPEEDPFEVI